MSLLEKALKIIKTPEMEKYSKDNGVVDAEGWFPPVSMQKVSKDEYRKMRAEWNERVSEAHSELLLKK